MKKTLWIFFFNLLMFGTVLKAQVTTEAFPMNPQSGAHNYFGIRVSLSQTYTHDVTVTGYIYDEGNGPNTNHPFSLTVTAGDLTAETAPNFYETEPTASATVELGSIATIYAGVSVTYEVSNGILKFNSTADVKTVLEQLDADYEAYNTNYENQYPNLTADELDDMDIQTGFDEFKPFRDFENLFTGFSSKRGEVENVETIWLANNFTGPDPDDIDLTFDDAENTIFNSTYSFKVGNDIYQLTTDGMYIGGVLIDDTGSVAMIPTINSEEGFLTTLPNSYNNQFAGPMATENGKGFINTSFYGADFLGPKPCKTNKKQVSPPYIPSGTNRRFILKVAINAIGIRNSIKTKVVHYKVNSNGKQKRARAYLSVRVEGNIYGALCNSYDNKSKPKPSNGGFYRRKHLKVVEGQWGGSIWRTMRDEVLGSFATSDVYLGSLSLTW